MSCGLFNNDILIEYNLFLEALQSIDCDIVVTRVGFCVHNYGNLEISLWDVGLLVSWTHLIPKRAYSVFGIWTLINISLFIILDLIF